ncbi:metallopeptidase family protein [Thermomicrobiaceae bacterium CFH 74404]|uniref:Metallopeptidase family protein n=2 Tax=Thermomicrobia TaxID=189775 RepID=A0AA42BAI5_9BACT|nr:metallopeptidase family protein [Thermalbibacter longus]MCM8749747.1 metallopeptidase family protein [Thermalbibacter longus]
MLLSRQAFERLVVEALEELPPEIAAALENVEIVIEREPNYRHRRAAGIVRGTLFGLYEGVPLTERTSSYNLVPPDVITIFQGPICRRARTLEEVRQIVRDTVIHEVAHHFGISDERLRELGRY